jgi:hypothetical protein
MKRPILLVAMVLVTMALNGCCWWGPWGPGGQGGPGGGHHGPGPGFSQRG